MTTADLLRTARRRFDEARPAEAVAPALAALATVDDSPRAANIHVALSSIYEHLSRHDAAAHHAREAVRLATSGRLRVQALSALAVVTRIRGRHDEAEAHYREALALADEDRATLLCGLGVVHKYAGRFDQAEVAYREALALIGPDEPAVASVWHNLGGLDHSRGRHAAGERTRAGRWSFVRRHPDRITRRWRPTARRWCRCWSASASSTRRRASTGRAMAVFERVYPPDHYDFTVTYNDLGVLLAAQGRIREVRDLYERAIDIKCRILGPGPRRRPHVAELAALPN